MASKTGGRTVICCNVSYVLNHNMSLICPSGCGFNDAFNEICHGVLNGGILLAVVLAK